ncbi:MULTISPECIES: haloacid dehalogenase type II [unclassified Mycobacterium]|uniref:haloacid dehalogenase type II n=1 Tax=unclassified Mycobacterium TaxID=2642494 RepID=UPI0027413328|nr:MULTISPECIES: haloacid dehalogenase type II [unclassified Mycobacterium]MDP7706741.1 haloacid dehalogenase type II [Mycobacterium sp. TY815]MDP7726454.1 haloacid dehalogenase type II [Mycobacterium sp. TY814]
MAIPSVLVFDVNETLIDIESLAPLFGELFGDRRVLREWFNQLVMYSMAATLSDDYVDFAQLAAGVLRMLADIHRVRVTDDDARRLTAGMRRMPAYPDSADGLAQLRDNGFRLVTLTNSPHPPGAPTALENAGLAGFFEHRFTVDSCRAFKPAPSVYQYVCDEIEVAPAECMMVASHVWDLLGAHNAGFGTALITRPGNAPLPVDALPQPDLLAGSLIDLARQLRPTTKGTD